MSEYQKGVDAKATIGEAMQVSQRAVIPAFIAARFSVILSLLAFVVSALALTVAVTK